MVFSYYIDPSVFSKSGDDPATSSRLLTLLRGISENGFLTIFDDQGFYFSDDGDDGDEGSAIVAAINQIGDVGARKKIKRMLMQLEGQKRIGEYLGPVESRDALRSAINKADAKCVHVVITERDRMEFEGIISDCVITNLEDYFVSPIERQRSEAVCGGAFMLGGEKENSVFLSDQFSFLMRHAKSVIIYDYFLGKGTYNFERSLAPFFEYLEENCERPEECLVKLHVGYHERESIGDEEPKEKIKKLLLQSTRRVKVQLNVYGDHETKKKVRNQFHHDRFLVINDFAFLISRGFDFLGESGMNSDVNIDLKSKRKVRDCINRLPKGLREEIEVR